MTLAVVGTGLVSPWGQTPEQHAFLLRAGIPGPPRSPFMRGEEDPLKVRITPWLGTTTALSERIEALTRVAVADALRPLAASGAALPTSLFVCSSAERAPEAPLLAQEAFAAHGRAPKADRVGEDASVFSALQRAARLVEADPRRLVAIVAVDSFVSLDALRAAMERAPSPWATKGHPLSEGAAALVVTSADNAREAGLPPLGVVRHAAVTSDAANDTNDDAPSGRAFASLLREAPPSGPFRFAFGPAQAGSLRAAEWHYATARNASRFEQACELHGIEIEVGRCGAAAGAMDLVFGLAALRADATSLRSEAGQPFLAWAISPDGTRGLAVAAVEALA